MPTLQQLQNNVTASETALAVAATNRLTAVSLWQAAQDAYDQARMNFQAVQATGNSQQIYTAAQLVLSMSSALALAETNEDSAQDAFRTARIQFDSDRQALDAALAALTP